MEKCYITNDLAEFLNSNPDAQYSEKTISKLIDNKKLDPHEISAKFPNYQMYFCGNCPVSKSQFKQFVKKNCIIKSLKPKAFCFEYKQEPVKISQINFET